MEPIPKGSLRRARKDHIKPVHNVEVPQRSGEVEIPSAILSKQRIDTHEEKRQHPKKRDNEKILSSGQSDVILEWIYIWDISGEVSSSKF